MVAVRFLPSARLPLPKRLRPQEGEKAERAKAHTHEHNLNYLLVMDRREKALQKQLLLLLLTFSPLPSSSRHRLDYNLSHGGEEGPAISSSRRVARGHHLPPPPAPVDVVDHGGRFPILKETRRGRRGKKRLFVLDVNEPIHSVRGLLLLLQCIYFLLLREI